MPHFIKILRKVNMSSNILNMFLCLSLKSKFIYFNFFQSIQIVIHSGKAILSFGGGGGGLHLFIFFFSCILQLSILRAHFYKISFFSLGIYKLFSIPAFGSRKKAEVCVSSLIGKRLHICAVRRRK